MRPNSNGIGSGGFAFALFELQNETAILDIHFPQHPNIAKSYELRAGSKVIKRVNYEGLEDVHLLPYTIAGEEMVQLDFLQQRTVEGFTAYNLSIVIEGGQNQYSYPYLVNGFTLPEDLADLRKQLPFNN